MSSLSGRIRPAGGNMTPSLFRVVVAAAAASVIPVAMVALSPSGQGVGDQRAGDGRLIVTIVSSRADMITGGDALVRATGAGAAQGQLTWELNGQRISLINALPARESMRGKSRGPAWCRRPHHGYPTRQEHAERKDRRVERDPQSGELPNHRVRSSRDPTRSRSYVRRRSGTSGLRSTRIARR